MKIIHFACIALLLLALASPTLSRKLEGSMLDPDCNCDPGHHGGHRSPTPVKPVPTPSHGGYYPTPSTPSHPTHPVTPIVNPPVIPTPTIPVTPIVTPPVIPVPTIPVSPAVPHFPGVPSPTMPDPGSFPPFKPGSCSYWISHPNAIYAIFGYWGTIGQTFGAACGAAFGKNLTIPDALKNTRSDGIGALYREGTAALLNSLSCKSFPFSAQQVKDAFSSSISSNNAAAAQALIFKRANEGGVQH